MKPQLTDDMREYLAVATVPATQRVDDVIRAFIRRFNLDPAVAGKLLGAWILERKS